MTSVIGVDVGGTFSDLTFISPSGAITILKVPSTPKDQSIGVQNALVQLKDQFIGKTPDLDILIHGSTVATNAVLERKGATTALITTKGFKDVIEIGRQTRRCLYDLNEDPINPLAPRNLRFEIAERVGADGRIIEPINHIDIKNTVKSIPDHVESVAICLIFSFQQPIHEIQIEKLLSQYKPDLAISRSSRVLPVFKEYERTSTILLDAYVKPIMKNYLKRFINRTNAFFQKEFEEIRIMKGDGGIVSFSHATERAAEIILSGLAGGVLGGVLIQRMLAGSPQNNLDTSKIVSLDIGGTSTDVSLILNGNAIYTRDCKISDLPLSIPSVDVVTVGAGGGSIAHIGKNGLFQVGPLSAGASPGPACYGQGGTDPTVTDADLLAGRLNPKNFCGGTIDIFTEQAKVVIEALADQLKISIDECINGILTIADTNVVTAVRKVSLERGHDPRQCIIASFGGAGPTHVCSVASLANIKIVVIPPYPGVWSSVGLLTADHRRSEMKSILKFTKDITIKELFHEYKMLESKVVEFLQLEGISRINTKILWEIDCRYKGQSYELNLSFPQKKLYKTQRTQIIREMFESEHYKIYGFRTHESLVEIVNIRVIGMSKQTVPQFQKPEEGNRNSDEALLTQRSVLFEDWIETDIFLRQQLKVGNLIQGPAIIEQPDSTSVVLPGWVAECDPTGCLILKHIE